MDSFKIYTQSDISALTNQREGEEKLGERVLVVSSLDQIINSSAKFVLLGIPEDIGVRANLGVGGAKTAWKPAIKALLNTQSNSFLNGEEILVLGHFQIEDPAEQSLQSLRKKVNQIDELVYPIVEQIIAANKIPIIIGGGHNNAFPIIYGAYLAKGKQQINVVNIDAHTDLRNPAEGRHSGNGFSTAIVRGYLKQYKIFGLHQNYINKDIAAQIDANQNINIFYFEDLLQSEKSIVYNWVNFTENLAEPCGLEIDLDSIANILSSATTPSGFALDDIRKILINNAIKYNYLHICEGAIKLADGREDITTGKTIAYLVTDFIKALQPRISLQQ